MTRFEDTIKKAGDGSEYTLSDSERGKMDRVLKEYRAMKPLPQAPSYTVSLSYSWFSFAHRPMAAALVLVLVFGSGVSYAAENALPGDALYPVKTYINEPAKVALATNAEAKAEVQIELAERRIEEAAFLAAEGRLDEETEDNLAVAFESHAEAVAEHIAEADTDDDGIGVELASRFENRLAAHENILLEVEDEGGAGHSMRLADAIRAASETAVNISVGTAVAVALSGAEDTAYMATGEAEAPDAAASSGAAEPTIAMTMVASDTPAPAAEARSAKVAVTIAMPAQAPAPSVDAKTISRMKAAAERSLKNVQKKFKSAKSLSAEARAQAEADLMLADSLMTEGSQHLEADAEGQAYAAFKESFRVSEQTSVYIKAAPTLEKARSRGKNNRTNQEGRVDSRSDARPETKSESHDSDITVEIAPVGATVTTPQETTKKKDESDDNHPDSDDGDKADHEDETDVEVKIKLDLSH